MGASAGEEGRFYQKNQGLLSNANSEAKSHNDGSVRSDAAAQSSFGQNRLLLEMAAFSEQKAVLTPLVVVTFCRAH